MYTHSICAVQFKVILWSFYRHQSMYACGEDFDTFIMTCINLMENGKHHDISKTLTQFLKRYIILYYIYMFIYSTFNASIIFLFL